MKNKSTEYIVQGAAIAALYAVLTLGQNIILPGSASMAIQFRIAEVMTVFALYTPAAIPGLTIGCVIANISSITAGLGVYDMVFGSLASLIAAALMYLLRNVRLKNIPIPALLMPALCNGIIVGFEIEYFFVSSMMGFNLLDFLVQGSLVAIGEIAVMFVLGLPFDVVLGKKLFKKT